MLYQLVMQVINDQTYHVLGSERNFRGRLNGIMLVDYSIGNCCQIFTTVSSVFSLLSVLISGSEGSKNIKQINSITL